MRITTKIRVQEIPVHTAQHFAEECLADKGYKFLRREGSNALWEFRGRMSRLRVTVKPDGQKVYNDCTSTE